MPMLPQRAPIETRKISILLFALAITIISSGSWALTPEDLPQDGQILIIEEDSYLELGPANSAFLNGTILLRGDGLRQPTMVLNNSGLLKLGLAASMNATNGTRLTIMNSGNLSGTALILNSSGGHISLHNNGLISVNDTDLLAERGGAAELINFGISSSNQSYLQVTDDGSRNTSVSLTIQGGQYSSTNAMAYAQGGRLAIDCEANLTLYNLALTGRAGARINVQNGGHINITNANLQGYGSTNRIDNAGFLRVLNAYVKDQNDEGGRDAMGTCINNSGEMEITNFSVVDNGCMGLVQIDLGATTRVSNLNCDANYGGTIRLRSLDGSECVVGNAIFDASGSSHGSQSQIILETYVGGNLTMNNAGFSSSSASNAILNHGFLGIHNQNCVSRDYGILDIRNDGHISIHNMLITTERATSTLRNAGDLEIRNLMVEDEKDSTSIITDGTLTGNTITLRAIGGNGGVLFNCSGATAAERLLLEASRGGTITLHALNGELSLGTLSLNSTGQDKGIESSIIMINGPGVTVGETQIDGFRFEDLSLPGGPDEMLLTHPLGGKVRMTNHGDGIVIGQRYALALGAALSLLGLIQTTRTSRDRRCPGHMRPKSRRYLANTSSALPRRR